MGSIVRAFFTIVCASIGLFVAVQLKSPPHRRREPVEVVRKPAPVHVESTREQRLRTIAVLGGSSIVTGALVALFVSVAIAVAVGTITSLLK